MFQEYHANYVNPYQRQRVIERVHRNWIKGVLESSLSGATFIPLGLYERPDLIDNLRKDVLPEKERPGGPLPAGTSITQVYDDSEDMLLILGQPGSSKTTLLLQLAHTLLERAGRDRAHPSLPCSILPPGP